MAANHSAFPAHIWLRVDALEPLTCSVRFSLEEGEGYLDWGQPPATGRRGTARAGAAGGLSIGDLPQLTLVVHPGGQRPVARYPLRLPSLPAEARARPGTWVQVDPSGLDHESTDLVFATDVLEGDFDHPEPDVAELEDDPSHATAVAVEHIHTGELDELDELDELITDVGAVPLSPPAPERTPVPARPGGGSALVRSLVQRIRQQEEEIKSLKQQLAALRSAQG